MLVSYSCFVALSFNPNLRTHQPPKVRFCSGHAPPESKKYTGRASKSDLSLEKSAKIETKHSSRWFSYGGSIPLILKSLESVDDLDEALKSWEGNINNKERTIILKEQTNYARALQIFRWFESKGCYELNVIHYNIVLRLLGRARRWDLISLVWFEMKSKGILPTNSTYGTLIDAYSKGGMRKQALVWLGEMCKQGVEPDEVTMGVVVQTYKKAGEFRKAEEFFKKWSSVSIDDAADEAKSQTSYSLYTYNTLIDTYGKAGDFKQASETFARMLREGVAPDTVTFNTMIHVCGNCGCLEEVESLISTMEEIRCFPDTRTYNILISLYSKSDDIGSATKYFLKMKAEGLVPDIVSYRTLLYAFSIRKMVGEAEALIVEMGERGLEIDEYTQSSLTRMYISVLMLEDSWSWFERFCDTMSSRCFSANIDAYGEKGHLELAEKAFGCCLQRNMLSALVFNVMIKAYGIAKEYNKACELFEAMENHGILPDKCTYNSIIQILSSAKLPHRAAGYVRRMQQEGLMHDCIPYSMVITSFCKLGELIIAESLFWEMVNSGLQPDIVVFSVLINGFAEAGSVWEATNYIEAMKSAGLEPNSIICNSLIKLYTKVGYLQEAEETYELLKAMGDGPDVYSSNCMIDLYCENSMVQEAESVFKNLKRRGEANEFSHAMMLCLYKKTGRFAEAYEIAQEMKALGLLTETLSYNNVISLYTLDGRMKEAVENFQQMLASGVRPNDATFGLLGVVLLRRGASKEAIKHLETVRTRDAQSGVREWVKALCSMVRLDDAFPNFGGKIKGRFESLNLKQCSYG